jgi:hypothetical protein
MNFKLGFPPQNLESSWTTPAASLWGSNIITKSMSDKLQFVDEIQKIQTEVWCGLPLPGPVKLALPSNGIF